MNKVIEVTPETFVREGWCYKVYGGSVTATLEGKQITHIFRQHLGSGKWFEAYDATGGGIRSVDKNVSPYALISITIPVENPLLAECEELLKQVPVEGLRAVRTAMLQAIEFYGEEGIKSGS